MSSLFDLDLSANNAKNLPARQIKIGLYECPSDGAAFNSESGSTVWQRWRYNYAVNWGNTNKAQTNRNIGPLKFEYGEAPFTFGVGVALKKITDGTSKTMMYSEVITAKGDDWLKNGSMGDCTICRGGQGFTAFNSPNSSTQDIMDECPSNLDDPDHNCRSTGAMPGDKIGYLSTTAQHNTAARSKHAGGVNVAMCDGSANFTSDDIELAVWKHKSTALYDPVDP